MLKVNDFNFAKSKENCAEQPLLHMTIQLVEFKQFFSISFYLVEIKIFNAGCSISSFYTITSSSSSSSCKVVCDGIDSIFSVTCGSGVATPGLTRA